MKRILTRALKTVLFIGGLCLVSLMQNQTTFAGVNDFYFSDFTGDYYLTKDSEGISRLKVVESVTAVFPDHNQNKGICRQIPFTNQDDNNITLPNLTRDNLKLTRNGVSEPIYSIEKESNYYNVCTGTEEYVLGEQTYVFEYEFEKVITEFQNTLATGEKTYQELYWDTNGNGATQRFDSVTARLHFAEDVLPDYTGNAWCYVGKYGSSGQDRCMITKLDDGVEFAAKNLKAFENLTFDVELKSGSFVIPGPVEDYAYVYLTIILGVICLAAIVITVARTSANRAISRKYRAIFVKPEYQPSSEYGLTEMAEIYLEEKKSPEVAMLLSLIVNHKVGLRKDDKKKWSIVVKDGVSGVYDKLLSIINGGQSPAVGDVIEVKQHTATSTLIALKKQMDAQVKTRVVNVGLAESGYTIGSSRHRGASTIIGNSIVVFFLVVMAGLFLLGILSDVFDLTSSPGKIMVFEEEFMMLSLLMIAATVITCVVITSRVANFKNITDKGLMASKYMEGLKLYIEMAEADRLKMLQSVEGADTSADGIVKLYEKLLPYAAIFGLEESWMKEMQKYCEVSEIEQPDYLTTGIAVSDITRSLHSAAAYAASSTTMSSSGGSSSSGFSGGGGGGFSGGGGGGGGFSGR